VNPSVLHTTLHKLGKLVDNTHSSMLLTLQIFTNGVYKSVEHRVFFNESRERISIAGFCNPRGEKIVGPIETLINDCNPPLYKSMNFNEYRMFIRTSGTNGKAYLNLITTRKWIHTREV
jgi:hypothetical protein